MTNYPKLLLPELVSTSKLWCEMGTPQLLENEFVNSAECFRLRGGVQAPGDTEVWISLENFAIRRLRTQIVAGSRTLPWVGASPQQLAYFKGPGVFTQYEFDLVEINRSLSDTAFLPNF
jgi:hypothetical protein